MNKLSIISIIIISLIFFNVPAALANTWSPPAQGCVPPNCNTAEPIDVSSRAQIKSGPLTIQDTLTVNNVLTIGQGGDAVASLLYLWARGSGKDVKLTISGTDNNTGQLNITLSDITSGSTYPYGKINFLSAYSANDWDLTEFEVQANTVYLGGDSADTIYVRGNLQVKDKIVDNDSTDLYIADQLSVGHPAISGGGITVGSGQNLIYGNTAASPQGNLLLLQVNEVDKFKIDASGNTTIAGNLTVNGSLSVSGGGIYLSNPTEIKETTGMHNADFSVFGGATNGWQGIKNFILDTNGCSGTGWHVCQSWELSYIYMQGISTANCDTHTTYQGDTVDNVCLGWVIGPVAESTIETEEGFMEAGDCYGYKSEAIDIYHSAVWYIDQWGAATCDSLLPVLCCK